jgi:hypothetical protein
LHQGKAKKNSRGIADEEVIESLCVLAPPQTPSDNPCAFSDELLILLSGESRQKDHAIKTAGNSLGHLNLA